MSSATRYSWLLCSRLRASRDWELVLIDRLPAAERHSFGQGFSSDVYGILRPLSNDRPIKAVGPDTALLFITLQEAMPLPAYVKAGFGDESDSAIAQLVGDGIFEVEIQGEWMSGPRALDAAINPGVDIPVPTAETARAKSRLALMMAAALPSPEPDTLFSFLYRYGTTPVMAERMREWRNAGAIFDSLGLDQFESRPVLSTNSAWWTFPGSLQQLERFSPKLYVGVAGRALKEALRRMASVPRKTGRALPPFKIGASLHGLHRPDRLVLYPTTVEEARHLALHLNQELAGLPPDPVPFTAEFAGGRHVSWGADPSRERPVWWDDEESWRGSLLRTLSVALSDALRAGVQRPWTFAEERARLAGIDPDTWAATYTGWEM